MASALLTILTTICLRDKVFPWKQIGAESRNRTAAKYYSLAEHNFRLGAGVLATAASQVASENIWRILVVLNYNTARFLH
jgi:hypothetical protein